MPDPARFTPRFCGLPCREMTVEVASGGALRASGGCPVCRATVARYAAGDGGGPRVAGAPASLERAIAAAADLLRQARAPFVFGLARGSTSAARAAAAIAGRLGAGLDVEGGEAMQDELAAIQSLGLPSATFGEIRNRADVVLLWRCDPRLTHPALFDAAPPGAARPAPRGTIAGPRRFFLVLPVTAGAGSAAAGQDGAECRPYTPRSDAEAGADGSGGPAAGGEDVILPVRAGGGLDAALALRALARGEAVRGDSPGGAPLDVVRRCAEALRAARYAAIVWDRSTSESAEGFAVIAALIHLARDLNRAGRGVARPLGGGGNFAGATAALLGATGYPRAVLFGPGGPRYAPGEAGGRARLEGGSTDAVLLVGADAVPRPRAGATRTVVVGPWMPEGLETADVFVPTGLAGLTAAGTAQRADGITVTLPAILPTTRPSEDEGLAGLARALAGEARADAQD